MRRLVLLSLALGACAPPPSSAGPTTGLAPSAKQQPPDPDAWRNAIPKPGTPAKISYPVPETAVLPNGLSLWVVRRPTAVASISVVVRHGASSVPSGKSGLAALTARMLTEGTQRRSASALAEAAEALGSTLDHDAGRDYMSVGISTLGADIDKAVNLLGEVVESPGFSRVEFARVQKEWIDSLVAERQDPDRLASLAGLRLLLGDEQGAPVGGSIVDVKKLAVSDLAQFHAKYFVPSSSTLIVVGDTSLAAVKEAAEKAFGGWKGKSPPEPSSKLALEPPKKTRVVTIDRPDSVQTAVFVAQPFPSRDAAGYEVREVLNGVLGGLFTSRINHNLREEHAYTYGAHSDAVATRRWGAFLVQTSVETNVTADALRELLKELRRAKDPALGAPIEDREVSRAKVDLKNRLGAHLEQAGSVAGDLESAFTLGLQPDYFARYGETNARITTGQVAAEAKARLLPDRLLIVIVGDQKQIAGDLVKQGFAPEAAGPELTE